MKITVIYDNEAVKPGLVSGWGFSALIETEKSAPVLFDTGDDGPALLQNMHVLGINAGSIGAIVISHYHHDHTGGLASLLDINKGAELYFPASYKRSVSGRKVNIVTGPTWIAEDIFSTGELEGIEQSLAVKTKSGILAIVGCSHPGVEKILDAAGKLGKVYGIIGGFHGFRNFQRLRDLSLIGPCHCTQYKSEILKLYPQQCVRCGAGLVVEQ